jgi:hypothetical protein
MKNPLLIIFIILSIYIFESCSAPTYLTSWVDPKFKGKKFKKIMVIALVKDADFRKSYENSLSLDLTHEGVIAINSTTLLNFDTKYTSEDIGRILQDGKYDGLLTLRYVDTDVQKLIHPNIAFFDYYWNWVSVYNVPGYVEKHKTVKMEVSLFSPLSKTPVWYGTTRTRDASGVDELSISIADEVTNNLIDNGLIK